MTGPNHLKATRLNIAITGISGYIGSRLADRLDMMPDIGQIIGMDTKQPAKVFPRLKFYRINILKPLNDILLENNIDSVVHLAFILRPTHQKKLASQVDIEGTESLLASCWRAGVKYMLYLSSHTVYGAYRDNPVPIIEKTRTHPLAGFQYSEDKARVEQLLLTYSQHHPEIQMAILRTCPVIGQHAANSISTAMMQPAVMIRIRGYDPPMQFVHENDLMDLMSRLILNHIPGIYNIAGDGVIKYSEIAKLAGKKMLILPEWFIRPLLKISWKLHLQNQSPQAGLEFIKYPPIVDTEAIKNRIKFQFQHTSREAVAAFLNRR